MNWEDVLKIADADIGDWAELLREINQLSISMRKAFDSNDIEEAKRINEEILVKSNELSKFYHDEWQRLVQQRPEFDDDAGDTL
jgi:hypothetical protein